MGPRPNPRKLFMPAGRDGIVSSCRGTAAADGRRPGGSRDSSGASNPYPRWSMTSATKFLQASGLNHVPTAVLLLTLLGACADHGASIAGPETTPHASRAAGDDRDSDSDRAAQSGLVAFGSGRDGGPPEIWVMNTDGSNPTQLTNSPGPSINGQPDWAPNGRRIAFMSTRTGDAEVFVMAADGSGQTNLTNHPATDQAPVWSPNGRKIAFHSNRDGNFELYVLDLRTGALRRLTTHTGMDQFPDWSPNGRRIAFQRDGDIYVLDLRSGTVVQLTFTPQVENMPSWSPNGKRIAFMSQRDGYPSVYVMDADGSNQVNLTPRPVGETASWQSGWPSWSPNGRRIYFQATRPETGPGNVEIFVADADGTGIATRLTYAPGTDSAPVARGNGRGEDNGDSDSDRRGRGRG